MTHRELLALATEARERAYAPYSGISVGAALLTRGGKAYTGVNVENASYPAGLCAERAALASAVSGGEREFAAVALAGGRRGKPSSDAFCPCGICLQALSEFTDGTLEVITVEEGAPRVRQLSDLLPDAFGAEALK